MLTEEQKIFINENYPKMGKQFCCDNLVIRESQVRTYCSANKIRFDRSSQFFKEFQERAAKSKIGRKRPEHSLLMKQKAKDGLLPIITSKRTDEQRKIYSDRLKNTIAKKGHPKGMLGKTHTEKNKKISSINSLKRWEDKDNYLNSDKHKQECSDRQSKIMNERINQNPNSINSRSKKGNIEIGGKKIFARSTWEANIAAYFEFLKSKGEIKDWFHEPETFWFLKIKRGVRSYKPDFKIINNDDTFYFEEVKGWMDDKSKTKINRMRIYYPLIELRVLGEKRYKEIAKNKSLFPNWGLLG